ncbi:unnamed protein product, partial [Brenthis ino]
MRSIWSNTLKEHPWGKVTDQLGVYNNTYLRNYIRRYVYVQYLYVETSLVNCDIFEFLKIIELSSGHTKRKHAHEDAPGFHIYHFTAAPMIDPYPRWPPARVNWRETSADAPPLRGHQSFTLHFD